MAGLPVVLGLALHLSYEKWVLWTGRTPTVYSPLETMVPHDPWRFFKIVVDIAATTPAYLGLFLLPVAVACAGKVARLRPAILWAGSLAVGLAALALLRGNVLPVLGNVLSPWGIGPLTLTDTYLRKINLPELPPGAHLAWVAATVAGALAFGFVAVVVAAMLVRSAGNLRNAWPQAMLLTVIAIYAAALCLLNSQAGFWLDRYLLLFVPPLLGLFVLAGPAPRRAVAPALLLAVFGAFSVLGTHDYLAWNRARWTALAELERQGIGPRVLDGGYEYNGWVGHDANYQKVPGKAWWWVIDDEWMLASGPVPGYRETASVPFTRWLLPGPAAVLTLRREPS
jgi:hypothetical protein